MIKRLLGRVRLDPAQLPRRLRFGRAAGTARRLALGKGRGLGSIPDTAEKIACDRFGRLALDVAFAPVPSPQSLKNPHRDLR
jgi:hypothetical protein